MNIFFTDVCPKQAAKNLCIVHINKMIVESCQMLSAAHHVIDGENVCPRVKPYLMKATHVSHPSTKWVRENLGHYNWLVSHVVGMLRLYEKYSNKEHSCSALISLLTKPPIKIKSGKFKYPPFVAPKDYQAEFPERTLEYFGNDVCKAYQDLLRWKYEVWQTRTDKRKMKVIFVNGFC